MHVVFFLDVNNENLEHSPNFQPTTSPVYSGRTHVQSPLKKAENEKPRISKQFDHLLLEPNADSANVRKGNKTKRRKKQSSRSLRVTFFPLKFIDVMNR